MKGRTTPTSRTDPDKAWTKRSRGKETPRHPAHSAAKQEDRRTQGGTGQEEDTGTLASNSQSSTTRKTRGGQHEGQEEDAGLASAARGQQLSKSDGQNTTLAGQGATAGQEEDKTRTQSLWAHQPVWPAFFPKREPQTVNRLVNKNIFKVIYIYIQYYMWPWVKTWSSKPW